MATVRVVRAETPGTRTLVLDVPDWPGHVAGQHVDIRLTAEDGYQAERSYSIASAPESPSLELTVEHERPRRGGLLDDVADGGQAPRQRRPQSPQ